MRTIFGLTASLVFGIMLQGCSGGGNTTVNVNASRPSNTTAGNTVNSVANAAVNAANAVANAVTSVGTDSAENFLGDAAEAGMAEVEMGKLAAQKAANAEIKKFGQMMTTDHTKANTELKVLAAKKNIALPGDIGSLRSTVDGLSKLSGADFDKEYVDEMVDGHETDVAAFEKQASSAKDPDVKAFAAKTLPTLKRHLEMIKAIQAKLK